MGRGSASSGMTTSSARVRSQPPLFYHGTSSQRYQLIAAEGLQAPYLTSDIDLAYYYADQTSEADGSEPLVLEVSRVDSAKLEVDLPALEEPLFLNGGSEEELWAQIEASCQEQELESWRKLNWRESLRLVSSARYQGTVAPDQLRQAQ